MNMTKKEVMERLCALSDHVSKNRFAFKHAADCFCGHNSGYKHLNYAFDEEIIQFIEKAVDNELSKYNK